MRDSPRHRPVEAAAAAAADRVASTPVIGVTSVAKEATTRTIAGDVKRRVGVGVLAVGPIRVTVVVEADREAEAGVAVEAVVVAVAAIGPVLDRLLVQFRGPGRSLKVVRQHSHHS